MIIFFNSTTFLIHCDDIIDGAERKEQIGNKGNGQGKHLFLLIQNNTLKYILLLFQVGSPFWISDMKTSTASEAEGAAVRGPEKSPPTICRTKYFPPSLIYIYRSSLCVILSAVDKILHCALLYTACAVSQMGLNLSFIYYHLRSLTYSLIFLCTFMCICPCFRVWPGCVFAVSDPILGFNALYMRLMCLISVPSLARACSSRISQQRVSDTSSQRCLSSCIQSTGEAQALSSELWKPSLQTVVS